MDSCRLVEITPGGDLSHPQVGTRFAFKEWKGAPTEARLMVFSGIGLLVLAAVVIGYGDYIGR